MSFKISDKVVCVDDSSQDNPTVVIKATDKVVRGAIYVVRGFDNNQTKEAGLLLAGMFGGRWADGDESGWRASRFRKLDELKAESEARYYINHPELAPA
jgi:hypothetical protein